MPDFLDQRIQYFFKFLDGGDRKNRLNIPVVDYGSRELVRPSPEALNGNNRFIKHPGIPDFGKRACFSSERYYDIG